jgi:ParB-like chromosome segregation protein Spo0J
MTHDGPVIPTGEVHPVADLFPMLPDDELQELADDIRANGLQHPIVLDKDGVLIDGRNRWAACQIAGVDPKFTTINGQDPVAYILSSNIARRHMNKGQRAMAVAKACSFSEQSQRRAAASIGIAAGYVGQAAIVIEYAPDITTEVLAGTLSLNDAYAIAQEAKREKATAAELAEQNKRLLEELRKAAPDLAERVADDSLRLSEAVTLWHERQRDELDRRRRDVMYFENAATMLWSLLRDDPASLADNWIDGLLKKMTVDGLNHLQTGDGLRALAVRIETLAVSVDRRGGLS